MTSPDLRLARRAAARRRIALAALALAALAWGATAQAKEPWDRGSNWLTVKGGYAKAAIANAADGNLGFGVGYSRFLSKQWSLGLQVQYDVLGRYSGPAEVEMPITLETAYHFNWHTAAYPYLGLGGGIYHHQFLNTGFDEDQNLKGFYLLTGVSMPLGGRSLLQVETRSAAVFGVSEANPVFPRKRGAIVTSGGEVFDTSTAGAKDAGELHVSAKIAWTWLF